MKLTKSKLKQLIKEEIEEVLVEKLGPEFDAKADAMLARSGHGGKPPTNGFSQKKKPARRSMTRAELGRAMAGPAGQEADRFQAMARYAIKGNKKALRMLQWAAKTSSDAQALLDAVYENMSLDMSPEELEFELN